MTDPIRRAAAARQARRTATASYAQAVTCPTCQADPGKDCHLPGRPRLSLDAPHTDRITAAATDRTATALVVRCPTCNARPHTPCHQRTDPHPLRWGKGRKAQEKQQ